MQTHANVQKFRQLVAEDGGLQTQIMHFVGNGRWDAPAIVKLAKGRGMEISPTDLVDVFTQDDELSDFELEMVSAASPVACDDT